MVGGGGGRAGGGRRGVVVVVVAPRACTVTSAISRQSFVSRGAFPPKLRLDKRGRKRRSR